MDYLLPHHPSLLTIDPLDCCGDVRADSYEQDAPIPHEIVVQALLSKASTELMMIAAESETVGARASVGKWAVRFGELIQDIAYSLHNDGDMSTGFLEDQLATEDLDALESFRRHLFDSAISLKSLFPSASLSFISRADPFCVFAPREVDALLAHLVLGTVQIPKGNEWGRPGFTAMYYSDPSISSTVSGYLATLVHHFATGGYTATSSSSFLFQWTYSTTSIDMSAESLASIEAQAANVTPTIKEIASEPTESASSSSFILLSAHSQPGPGPAGTHEERLMGQSPTLAVTSLICPKLDPDVALVTSTFPVHAAWEGHNRYAKLVRLYHPWERVSRRYIIADAAELDVAEHGGLLPDLGPGMVEREIGKLEAAFGGALRAHITESLGSNDHKQLRRGCPDIEVVPWGCQAFGGNLVVKAQCMMMAAGLAGIDNITLLMSSDRQSEAEEIVAIARQSFTVGQMYSNLRHR